MSGVRAGLVVGTGFTRFRNGSGVHIGLGQRPYIRETMHSALNL